MRTTCRQAFLTALLCAGLCGGASATPLEALADLEAQSPAFQSRTCGLVLLSLGRAQAASAKAAKSEPEASAFAKSSMAQLVEAFLMLRDGRDAIGQPPRDMYAKLSPNWTPVTEAQAFCKQLYDARLESPAFNVSEEARAEAAASAMLTFETE